MMWLAVRAFATIVYCVWTFSGCILTINGVRKLPLHLGAVRWCYHELKVLYPVAYVVTYGPPVVTGHLGPVDIMGMVFGITNWFTLKDSDDDDRWKRRRRKLAERVARVGGRLTVVADGAR